LYRIVCKSAWGKLTKKSVTDNDYVWTLAHDQLTFERPENPSLLGADGTEASNIVTYQDFLDLQYKRVKLPNGDYDPAIE